MPILKEWAFLYLRKGKMMNKSSKNKTITTLIKLAEDHYEQEHSSGLTPEELKTYKKYPHFFVIGCLMDRQIKANNAWSIPYAIEQQLGTPDIMEWNKCSAKKIFTIFKKHTKHRFKENMADVFCEAVKRIVDIYEGDASRLWKNSENCAEVIYNFLAFKGCGIKIATMAVNILTRMMHVKLKHMESLDISPDSQVKKIMINLGLIDEKASNEMIIYKARDIYPECPGKLDPFLWYIGSHFCIAPQKCCSQCPINSLCFKKEA